MTGEVYLQSTTYNEGRIEEVSLRSPSQRLIVFLFLMHKNLNPLVNLVEKVGDPQKQTFFFLGHAI